MSKDNLFRFNKISHINERKERYKKAQSIGFFICNSFFNKLFCNSVFVCYEFLLNTLYKLCVYNFRKSFNKNLVYY